MKKDAKRQGSDKADKTLRGRLSPVALSSRLAVWLSSPGHVQPPFTPPAVRPACRLHSALCTVHSCSPHAGLRWLSAGFARASGLQCPGLRNSGRVRADGCQAAGDKAAEDAQHWRQVRPVPGTRSAGQSRVTALRRASRPVPQSAPRSLGLPGCWARPLSADAALATRCKALKNPAPLAAVACSTLALRRHQSHCPVQTSSTPLPRLPRLPRRHCTGPWPRCTLPCVALRHRQA
jgi:hypothetical protein